MKFEHIVVINEPANPLVTDLTREELWFGLLCRAEDPRPFLPGLEACTIVERSETTLLRELRFGAAVIRDKVEMVPMESMTFESSATAEHAGGTLTISIEEPAPAELVLRFSYRTTLPDAAGDPDGKYAGFVKSAYHSSDLDTVRVIRMIAESGRLQ
ncbi:MAG: SRPBCC family protein [Rhodocyclaceae bacterium]